ncbi:MAG: rhodanese-like domain-containing protein [Planctomycetota bacterium]|nr:MAG: rhodanese-like domain-containing protein [Planctomycetota bacterium]
MQPIDVDALRVMLTSERRPTVINTLAPENFAQTRIPDSINIPQDQDDFAERVKEAAGGLEKPVVVYCASEQCQSSAKAAEKLDEAGFTEVYDFEGGAKAWREAGESLESSSA